MPGLAKVGFGQDSLQAALFPAVELDFVVRNKLARSILDLFLFPGREKSPSDPNETGEHRRLSLRRTPSIDEDTISSVSDLWPRYRCVCVAPDRMYRPFHRSAPAGFATCSANQARSCPSSAVLCCACLELGQHGPSMGQVWPERPDKSSGRSGARTNGVSKSVEGCTKVVLELRAMFSVLKLASVTTGRPKSKAGIESSG